MTTFWTEAKITVLGSSSFDPAPHLLVENPDHNVASAPEQLAEYAGRICYMSQRNPAGRTTAEYNANIIQQQHGSVLEHATFHFLIEGVSRALTHELIRHRAGTAVSQLSQRYVDASDTDFVIPPAIQQGPPLGIEQFKQRCVESLEYYEDTCKSLEVQFTTLPPVLRRKRAREAARAMLPNATETKVVWTANGRALRHILELRGSAHADLEIQRFAGVLYRTVAPLAPSFFADFHVEEDGSLSCQYHKV